MTDMLLEAMDNKELSIVIFLDVSKAFDSVHHVMLLQRILNLGVYITCHALGRLQGISPVMVLQLYDLYIMYIVFF